MADQIIRVYASNLTPFKMFKQDAWVFDDWGEWSDDLEAPNEIPARTTGVWQSEQSGGNLNTKGFAKYAISDGTESQIVAFLWDGGSQGETCSVLIEPPEFSSGSNFKPHFSVTQAYKLSDDYNADYYGFIVFGPAFYPFGEDRTTLGSSWECDVGIRWLSPLVLGEIAEVAPIPSAPWTRVGSANHVMSIAFDGTRLIALTKDGRLWTRRPGLSDEVWAEIDTAPKAREIACTPTHLVILDSESQLKAKPIAGGEWMSIGDAFPVQEAASTSLRVEQRARLGGTVEGRTTSSGAEQRSRDRGTVEGRTTRHSRDTDPHFIALTRAISERRTVNQPLRNEREQTGSPVLREHALTIAAYGDELYFTSSAGQLWSRPFGISSTWKRLSPTQGATALTCTNRKLIGLNKLGELYARNASIDLFPWQKLNVETLPGASALAGVPISATSFYIFAATRDNELFAVDVSPMIA
jgi:hypothetical protein